MWSQTIQVQFPITIRLHIVSKDLKKKKKYWANLSVITDRLAQYFFYAWIPKFTLDEKVGHRDFELSVWI